MCLTTIRSLYCQTLDSGLDILWVEDHRDTVDALAKLLDRRGHRVTTARTVSEAMDRAADTPFDVLVLDIGLPDGSGLEVLRRIREEHPTIPCIAISGFGMEADVKGGLDAGCDYYLVKPIFFQPLLDLLDKIEATHLAHHTSPRRPPENPIHRPDMPSRDSRPHVERRQSTS